MSSASRETSNIYTFDATVVEERIAKGDWSGCWDYLTEVTENLSMTASQASLTFNLQLQKDLQDDEKKRYVQEFGGLLSELFLFLLTEPSVTLSDKNFDTLMVLHEIIHTLFYIYDLDDTDAAVAGLLGDDRKKLNPTEQKKILVLLSLGTKLDIGKILARAETKYRLTALIAFGSYLKIFREGVYDNKVKVSRLRAELEKTFNNFKLMTYLTNVYFLSSYLNSPDKHKIKENINAAFRHYLSANARDYKAMRNMGLEKPVFKLDPARKTVLIIVEVFSKNHAMYRGWGPLARSIQNKFNVVFMIATDADDPRLRQDYENYYAFSNIKDLHKTATELKPDMVFMPSIGMRFYNILAANMRFAPIQVMGLGHPAASMSDQIDYVVSPAGLYDPAAFPKETYIADGYPQKYIPLVTREEFMAHRETPAAAKKEKIEIGVVGSSIKVSFPFFKLLKEIVETSPYEVHVSFIMGVGGIDSLYIEKYLKRNFPNCTYYGWQPYSGYLKTLKKMDILLNPFPFGHANTIIDTLMCGKPCIGLDGPEPASKTEGDILKAVGLKDMFVAKDEADYKEKFLLLAARIMQGDTEFYDRDNIYETIFADLGDYDYSSVFQWIYENHAKMKSSGLKYFEAGSNL